MSDIIQRISPPLVVLVVAALIVVLVNSIVSPLVEAKTRRVVNIFLGPRVAELRVEDPLESDDARIVRYWPCYTHSGDFAGLVAQVRTAGYRSQLELLLGVDRDGSLWGISVMAADEYGDAQRILDDPEGALTTSNWSGESRGVVRTVSALRSARDAVQAQMAAYINEESEVAR